MNTTTVSYVASNSRWLSHAIENNVLQSTIAPILSFIVAIGVSAALVGRVLQNKNKKSISNIPLLNDSTTEYLRNCRGLIEKGITQYVGKPFRLWTGMGTMVILPANYHEEIKNDDRVDRTEALIHFSLGYIPGMEAYKALTTKLAYDVVKIYFTPKRTVKSTEQISAEIEATLKELWTENHDWHQISLRTSVVSVTSGTSGAMYLPHELYRSREWLSLVHNYLVKSGTAKRALRSYPKFLHRWMHWFLRDFRELRAIMGKARDILAPIVEARKRGNADSKPDDALQWLEELSEKMGTTFEAAPYMIGLSFASNMTVTDVVMQSLLDLCSHPEYIKPIREEMATVMGSHATGAAMPALKLLDSAIKESTRIKPIFLALARNTVQDMTLSDGTFLPAHTHMALSCERPLDPEVYTNPRTYDPYRFLRIREALGSPGAGDGQAQLVSSSSAAVPHLLFGFGHHVCPGRFYGAHLAKLLVYHVLDKYDVRLADEKDGIVSSVAPVSFGLNEMANASATIMVRRRREQSCERYGGV